MFLFEGLKALLLALAGRLRRGREDGAEME